MNLRSVTYLPRAQRTMWCSGWSNYESAPTSTYEADFTPSNRKSTLSQERYANKPAAIHKTIANKININVVVNVIFRIHCYWFQETRVHACGRPQSHSQPSQLAPSTPARSAATSTPPTVLSHWNAANQMFKLTSIYEQNLRKKLPFTQMRTQIV